MSDEKSSKRSSKDVGEAKKESDSQGNLKKEVTEEVPEVQPTNLGETAANPIPTFITQTDAEGNPITTQKTIRKDTAISEETIQTVPDDVEGESCCSRAFQYVCCIALEETFFSTSVPSLLPPPLPQHRGKPCLVLDLDETLVHSSFFEVPGADFRLDVEMEGRTFTVFVIKRPGVDEFLEELSRHYELVIFTASVSQYAQRVIEKVDTKNRITHQLYRQHCTYFQGNFVKDMSRLNRPLEKCIIVDNSAVCYQFQPQNAIGVKSFLFDKTDRELYYCKDFLMNIKDTRDFTTVLNRYNHYAEIMENSYASSFQDRDDLVDQQSDVDGEDKNSAIPPTTNITSDTEVTVSNINHTL